MTRGKARGYEDPVLANSRVKLAISGTFVTRGGSSDGEGLPSDLTIRAVTPRLRNPRKETPSVGGLPGDQLGQGVARARKGRWGESNRSGLICLGVHVIPTRQGMTPLKRRVRSSQEVVSGLGVGN